MLRKITQAAGRFRPGNMHDYPRDTWNKIVRDLLSASGKKNITPDDMAEKLASFSEPIEFNPSLHSTTRGPLKIRRRLGSAAASKH